MLRLHTIACDVYGAVLCGVRDIDPMLGQRRRRWTNIESMSHVCPAYYKQWTDTGAAMISHTHRMNISYLMWKVSNNVFYNQHVASQPPRPAVGIKQAQRLWRWPSNILGVNYCWQIVVMCSSRGETSQRDNNVLDRLTPQNRHAFWWPCSVSNFHIIIPSLHIY